MDAVQRSPLALSFRLGLATVLAGGILLAGLLAALLPWDAPPGAVLALLPAAFLVFLVTGLVAWDRRPGNRMGPLLVGAAAALYLGSLANTEVPALAAVGEALTTAVLAPLVHLLHAFPSGRLASRASAATVAAGYAAVLLGAVAPGAWPHRVLGGGVMLATALLLARRTAAAPPGQRRVLAPLYAYGIVAVTFIPLSPFLLEDVLGLGSTARGAAQFVALCGVPLAFLLAMLRGAFARAGQVEELGTWLAADGDRPGVAAALASTLGDPTLRVAYWVPGRGALVDVAGRPADDGAGRPGRGQVPLAVGGSPVGAITYDSTLLGDPELVARAGRVVAIAVDRERLTAELKASNAELRRSRERLVEAGDAERRRIAQDLHDGIQMRLVLLALEAQRLGGAPDAGPETAARATGLRRDLDAAAADLRQLVHNVMPAALVERGLWDAVEDLADRMPVPTALDLRPGTAPLPPAVESTAYFVIAEALANTVKHALASSAAVAVAADGAWLRIAVDDDGVGGAAANGGAGMRGLADRVDTLAGRLEVSSEPGHGTHLRVELPCA